MCSNGGTLHVLKKLQLIIEKTNLIKKKKCLVVGYSTTDESKSDLKRVKVSDIK